MKYIWELPNWTHFTWNSDKIIEALGTARKKQGFILGKGDSLELKKLSYFLTEEAMTTSEIEGEQILHRCRLFPDQWEKKKSTMRLLLPIL